MRAAREDVTARLGHLREQRSQVAGRAAASRTRARFSRLRRGDGRRGQPWPVSSAPSALSSPPPPSTSRTRTRTRRRRARRAGRRPGCRYGSGSAHRRAAWRSTPRRRERGADREKSPTNRRRRSRDEHAHAAVASAAADGPRDGASACGGPRPRDDDRRASTAYASSRRATRDVAPGRTRAAPGVRPLARRELERRSAGAWAPPAGGRTRCAGLRSVEARPKSAVDDHHRAAAAAPPARTWRAATASARAATAAPVSAGDRAPGVTVAPHAAAAAALGEVDDQGCPPWRSARAGGSR